MSRRRQGHGTVAPVRLAGKLTHFSYFQGFLVIHQGLFTLRSGSGRKRTGTAKAAFGHNDLTTDNAFYWKEDGTLKLGLYLGEVRS